ncbi:ACR3 family arsenite transporter [Cryobacterium sp. MP_3.1]|uniref:arsenic resistance protein n=1 Tax=Cryobacterium sp. MP_3.1 TaxID=3071711 RepID=UPI002E0C2471|nr:ACR3 family arsenite transporter [Cryobacterium sp. MP_3.1]
MRLLNPTGARPTRFASVRRLEKTPWALTALLLSAIVAGSILGTVSPRTGEVLSGGVDATVLTLMCLLLFEVRFSDIRRLRSAPRFLMVAWCANFILIPIVGFAIASLFLAAEPLLFTGLLIYFLAPCTDWFLGFTRLAGGNTALGAVLLPVNLITQLALFPLVLMLFARTTSAADPGTMVQTIGLWFAVPVTIAVGTRTVLTRYLSEAAFDRLLRVVGATIPWILAVVIVEIFATHIGEILGRAGAFATILTAVVVFFTLTYLLGHTLSRIFRFRYPEHALLTMTTAARNAPLMLALTMIALPDQPLIYAAIIIGMLVEFPHLTIIRALLIRSRQATKYLPSDFVAPRLRVNRWTPHVAGQLLSGDVGHQRRAR